MTDALDVILGGSLAGSLRRSSGGRLSFAYAEAYLAQATPTPLSLSMPTPLRSHPDGAITPWLWGLLPDNDRVLARWAREFHVSASSPFSLLATPVGEDCAGAVQFVAPGRAAELLGRPGAITWLAEADVEARLAQLRRDATAWLGPSRAGRFSLAGAQAKTALCLEDGRFGEPSGRTPTTHILKPAVAGLDDHDLNEHLCLDAARRAGLLAVRSRVVRFGEESAVVVERYDRARRGAELERVHQEDLCQALGVAPSGKYQHEGGPGVRQVCALLRRSMAPRVAEEAVARFADALAWNWLIAGTDAHAKNYSLLLAGDQVRLAPLYDLASALPYGTHERKLKLAMELGGSYDLHLTTNPWPRASRELGLDADLLLGRVRELLLRGPDAFAQAASQPDVVALGRPLAATLVDLVAGRAARCLRLIGG